MIGMNLKGFSIQVIPVTTLFVVTIWYLNFSLKNDVELISNEYSK